MPYPPAVPPATRVNATLEADNHPADHNGLSTALSDIINELGVDPSGGGYPTVQARLEAIAGSNAYHDRRLQYLQGSTILVTTDVNGSFALNLQTTYPANPVVVLTPFSTNPLYFNLILTIYSVSTTNCGVIVRRGDGTSLIDTQIGVHWIAMSMA